MSHQDNPPGTDAQIAGRVTADLSSDDVSVRLAAAEQLMREPRLIQSYFLVLTMNDESNDVRDCIASALEDYGAPLPGDLEPLINSLRQPHADVVYWAATLLGRAGNAAEPAVGALIDVIQNRPEANVRERAVLALGQIGPAARDAVPTLDALSTSTSGRLQRLAHEALSAIIVNASQESRPG